ncbi:hypothetical protein [Nitrincola schmidtii]|uniref:hypothetical protein n=1 Tax=Nitrincola schmidtii TaxID=1730894 RepID=UPI00197EA49D|nr:hypothetical protein [Nitrincola schmidtii]
MSNDLSLGQELLNVPMGDMIRDMAFAIADAQMQLDANSVEVAEMMSGLKVIYDENGNKAFDDSRVYFGHTYDGDTRVPTRVSMLELGFTPTFYQFVDTIIEVKIAIKITQSNSSFDRQKDTSRNTNTTLSGGLGLFKATGSRNKTVNTSQVDATYSSRYSYSAEGASLLRTKLCPVPPPPILEDRIRALMELEASRQPKVEG